VVFFPFTRLLQSVFLSRRAGDDVGAATTWGGELARPSFFSPLILYRPPSVRLASTPRGGTLLRGSDVEKLELWCMRQEDLSLVLSPLASCTFDRFFFLFFSPVARKRNDLGPFLLKSWSKTKARFEVVHVILLLSSLSLPVEFFSSSGFLRYFFSGSWDDPV